MPSILKTNQRLTTAPQTKVSAAQRQSMVIRYALIGYIGLGFALSALLIYNDFFSKAHVAPHLAVSSPVRNVQVGDEVECRYELTLPKGLSKRQITLSQEWPGGVTFVENSLEVQSGSLRRADISAYGNAPVLQIAGIDPGQRKVRFSARIKVGEGPCTLGVIAPTTTLYIDNKPVRFGIESTIALQMPAYRVSHRILSNTDQEVRYQVVVANPQSGKVYGPDNQSLSLISKLAGVAASIEAGSVEIASLRPVAHMLVNGQTLEVKGITLGPGEIATLTFAARLQSPVVNGQQLTSRASVFVPHSMTVQSAETQIRF